MHFFKLIKIYKTFICFMLIFMQTCGLQIFSGQGWISMILLLLINRNAIKYMTHKRFNILLVFYMVFWGIMMLKGLYKDENDFIWCCYMSLTFASTTLFLLSYQNNYTKFMDDFYRFLKILYYYSLVHIIGLLFFKSLLTGTSFPMSPRTLGYILFYGKNSPIDGFYRIQGLAWEPGNWQLFMNLFLLLSIIRKEKVSRLILCGISIIFTFSTNGYILLLINILFYLFLSGNFKKTIVVASILFIATFPIIKRNIEDKLSGENLVSGMARVRDFAVGKTLITEHPLLGVNANKLHDLRVVNRVKENIYINNINTDLTFSTGFMEDGYLNGFLGVFLDWGVLIGVYLYFLFYKSPLLINKRIAIPFCIICFLSFTAEPITRTSFFFMFPLSNLIKNE